MVPPPVLVHSVDPRLLGLIAVGLDAGQVLRNLGAGSACHVGGGGGRRGGWGGQGSGEG